MSKPETKTPFKDPPVRQAGQSLHEQIERLLNDVFLPYCLAVIMTAMLAFWEWFRQYTKAPPQPIMLTVMFGIVLLITVRRIRKLFKEVRQLRLGEQGEKVVGQVLDEKLRPMGCQIIHDILSTGFNVDHFAVGPMGLFSIETKANRKPGKGECRVVFDGTSVKVNGMQPDRDPIVQAKSQARWMSDLIEQSTGKRFPVQPIVVYPGWYVETAAANPSVWVLNETVVPTFIKNARGSLSPEDVSLITFHLKRYVIAKSN
jgi:hypothetical protein